jgi:pseudaminic acid biosynthesis-associated methylase
VGDIIGIRIIFHRETLHQEKGATTMAATSRMMSVAETGVSETMQEQEWRGTFGKEYSEHNLLTPAALDALYEQKYGMTRAALNRRFLADVPKNARILEVGCNLGNQLLMLQEMGFTNLYGIEIISEIVQQSQLRLPAAKISEGSLLQIPFPEGYFDLIFTAGVLIHIAPADLRIATGEMRRCSKTWIWGSEYYAPEMTEIPYRGHRNLLWKTDYAKLYAAYFPDLEIVREEHLHYLNDGNVDTMFLLRRGERAV